MENPEEVLQSLDEFAKLKPKDIPRELEEYLSYVAKTGDPVYQWSIVKCLFREKLLNVITDFYENSPTIELPPCPNVDPFNYETMKNSLLERLDSFPSAPFTVQRLCELLTTPRKEYSRADKFMRAIEKNILVVSTREPGNIRRNDNNGQPELLMNGVMDGRGIELGEAIETVSSDGVNLMHADENEVNVTENENVPVECAGMEEIDMEEQGDQIAATNSAVWEKEQTTDTSVQSEEGGNLKNYEINDEEGENKPKENLESLEAPVEVPGIESTESRTESAESTASENLVESLSEVQGESNVELTTCSVDSKDHLEKTEDKGDLEASSCGSEENMPSEIPTSESNTPNPVVEEILENTLPDKSVDIPVSETSICLENESVDGSSSSNEELPKSSPETLEITLEIVNPPNEVPVVAEDTAETVSLVDDGPNISENVTVKSPAPDETISNTDSKPTEIEIPSLETSVKTVDSDVSVDNTDLESTAVEEPGIVTEEAVSDETTVVNTSEGGSKEEVVSNTEDDTTENEKKIEQQICEVEATVQQDEAMEVDDSVVSNQVSEADVDEPMDQSELPTEGQTDS